METGPVPAFINRRAGGAAAALEALRSDRRVDLREAPPEELEPLLRAALEDDPATVVVAGGDGTISLAASVLAGTRTALCVISSGTLNHFARRIGVPEDPREALELAFSGATTRVDAGRVNDRLFLNTCVIGEYVRFVSRRNRLKPAVGYALSSLAAGARTLADFRHDRMEVEFDDDERAYLSAVLFVGVGERDFSVPPMGEPIDGGRRGLHLLIAGPTSRARLTLMMARAAVRGIRPWPSEDHADTYIVNSLRVNLSGPEEDIALDGEIVSMVDRLDFRLDESVLTVRVPRPADGTREGVHQDSHQQ